jgi:hypothetical protein
MKKLFVVAALAASVAAQAAPSKEQICQLAGKYGAMFGEALETVSEDEIRDELEDMYRKSLDEAETKEAIKGASLIFNLQQQVLADVARNNLDWVVAEKLEYIKCKEGKFDK